MANTRKPSILDMRLLMGSFSSRLNEKWLLQQLGKFSQFYNGASASLKHLSKQDDGRPRDARSGLPEGLADGMHESGLDEAIEQLSDMSKPTKRM